MKIENVYWERVGVAAKWLNAVPFLRMVAVCNNLAFGRVDEKSDIDVFVVAKKGRLFFVRSFVTLIVHLLGLRRHGNKVAGRICLSFFVDDSHLWLEKIALKNDVYLAYWVKSMIPVIDNGVGDKFLKENEWIDGFFDKKVGSLRRRIVRRGSGAAIVRMLFYVVFRGFFGDFVEGRLKVWQMRRAESKAKTLGEEASIVIGEHILKFHNVDRRKHYRDLWEKKYGKEALITDGKFLSLIKP